jgi:hypothetical protein
MARGYTTRKLEVWAIHAHRDRRGEVDYRQLFRDLAKLDPTERIHTTSDKVIALPSITVYKSGLVRLQVYEGPRDTQPLVYDTEDGSERLATTRATEVVTTKTHAYVDTETREAIIEYNHRGAKAHDVAVVLGAVGRTLSQWRGLYVELAPQIDREFVEELERFERIRSASVRLSRPNVDWTDFSNNFTAFAADSDAQSGQVEMNAQRGKSLSKTGGIVAALRRVARAHKSSVQSATVRGIREGEAAETSLSLNDYKAHQKVSVRKDESGQVADDDIEDKIRSFARARRRARGVEDS